MTIDPQTPSPNKTARTAEDLLRICNVSLERVIGSTLLRCGLPAALRPSDAAQSVRLKILEKAESINARLQELPAKKHPPYLRALVRNTVLKMAGKLGRGVGRKMVAGDAALAQLAVPGPTPSNSAALIELVQTLTPSERRLAGLIADGASHEEAGAAFGVTGRTIHNWLTRIRRRLSPLIGD